MSSNKEHQFQKLCQEIYETSLKRIVPLYPWVLVRILPKEQMIGSVLMPETQNKTIREGIVLQTWDPILLKSRSLGISTAPLQGHRSALRLGDRVIFSHAEGMPVPFLDEYNYRLVREEVDQQKFPKMGVLAKLEYDGDKGLREKLDDLFLGMETLTVSGA